MAEIIYAENDYDFTVDLWTVSEDTGKRVPLTEELAGDDDVTAFFATSEEPDAVAADPSLSIVLTHVGPATKGRWMGRFNRDVMTAMALDALFTDGAPDYTATATPYLIIDQPNGTRTSIPHTYQRIRRATIT